MYVCVYVRTYVGREIDNASTVQCLPHSEVGEGEAVAHEEGDGGEHTVQILHSLAKLRFTRQLAIGKTNPVIYLENI